MTSHGLSVDSTWLAREALGAIELDRALLDGMLSFLLFAGALAIPAVLAARFLSVGLAALVPGLRQDFPPYVVTVLTWGGLRGGLVQGLTLSRLLRRGVR